LDLLPAVCGDTHAQSTFLKLPEEIRILPGICFNIFPREKPVIAGGNAFEVKASRRIRDHSAIEVWPLSSSIRDKNDSDAWRNRLTCAVYDSTHSAGFLSHDDLEQARSTGFYTNTVSRIGASEACSFDV
jgi:hypothetical protein